MGFRMVYKLSHLCEKKFWSIFSIRLDLSQKNAKKNYLFCNVNLLKAHIKFSRFMLF
jgi:hypothetical protein